MSESKHTPGPYTHDDRDLYSNVCAPDGTCLAVVHQYGSGKVGAEERRANGRLFAAAADLLEAVKTSIVALEAMIGELKNLPEGTFGIDSEGDGTTPGGLRSWPRRDELLFYLERDLGIARAALAKSLPSDDQAMLEGERA